MASIVERLTENIVERNLLREGAALSKKWERTGLLEGIDSEMTKTTMSRLLENQAKELLREASTMSAGDVEGFAAVAFPIVRRVFGGLIANELVAVQPMSLPSGLIFFLDFKYNGNSIKATDYGTAGGGPATTTSVATAGQSIYGGGVLASAITGGVDLTGQFAEKSFYALNNGFSSFTGSASNAVITALAGATGTTLTVADLRASGTLAGTIGQRVIDDPDLTTTDYLAIFSVTKAALGANPPPDYNNLVTFVAVSSSVGGANAWATGKALAGSTQVRRLTTQDTSNVYFVFTKSTAFNALDASNKVNAVFAVKDLASATVESVPGALQLDLFGEGAGTSTSGFNTSTGLTGQNTVIPEIDIKVDSIAVTAQTKKLKAKWSPELGQDLNAYHNLDAEVELTSILSEHVALEIDQEILNDLVKGATAGTKYWSRRPGKFVNRDTGASITSVGAPPDFTGNVSMWYETLVETINDVSAQIHRKTLRGGANFLVTSPEVANLLEFTSGFRADISMEELKGGSVGAVKAGAISKKWDVYVDPYFPRNLILVGRRGKAFLESGYVYAPYVPLMITPTIFGTEDFVPRKGLMTRYAKKMVRPDMYGLVICQDLIG